MKKKLEKSIYNSFEKYIKLLLEICESEIEKIFLLKIIDYILKWPDTFNLSFIIKESLTETIGGKNIITSKVNLQMPGDFGHLCGIKITYFNDIIIEIFPQHAIEIEIGYYEKFKYRLDFGIFKYDKTNLEKPIKKYCVECDGYEYHSTKENIKKDNKRARNILLSQDFATLRFLGTEIYNWDENDIGYFIFNILMKI